MNRVKNAPLKPVKDIEKLERGSADVVIDDNANIAFVIRKDKVIFYMIKVWVKSYCKNKTVHQGEESSSRYWATSMHQKIQWRNGLDQNIATYMIAHRSKKWWWPIFRFCVGLCAKMHFKFTGTKKRAQGKSQLTSLDSDAALLTPITDVTEKPPK